MQDLCHFLTKVPFEGSEKLKKKLTSQEGLFCEMCKCYAEVSVPWSKVILPGTNMPQIARHNCHPETVDDKWEKKMQPRLLLWLSVTLF